MSCFQSPEEWRPLAGWRHFSRYDKHHLDKPVREEGLWNNNTLAQWLITKPNQKISTINRQVCSLSSMTCWKLLAGINFGPFSNWPLPTLPTACSKLILWGHLKLPWLWSISTGTCLSCIPLAEKENSCNYDFITSVFGWYDILKNKGFCT